MSKVSFKELGERIIRTPSKHRQKLIGIDGCGGVGKSTFAGYLEREIPNSIVIHGDDFYKDPWDKRLEHTDYVVNPNFDWERLAAEVFEPLKEGKPITYRIFNWHTGKLDSAVSVPLDASIIIEGGYMTQKRFTGLYDFRIWIDADDDLRLERALLRDGEHMRHFWEEDWIPVEKNYRRVDNPAARADVVVLGHQADYATGSFEAA